MKTYKFTTVVNSKNGKTTLVEKTVPVANDDELFALNQAFDFFRFVSEKVIKFDDKEASVELNVEELTDDTNINKVLAEISNCVNALIKDYNGEAKANESMLSMLLAYSNS